MSNVQVSNRLLASLSPEDFALLEPMLTSAIFRAKQTLQISREPIEYIYFPDSGLASVVMKAGGDHRIEVGVIGREGATGLSFVMGAARSPYDIFVQSAGTGWQLSAPQFREAMQASPTLGGKFLLFGHTQCVQMASTVLANGKYTITQRLARWLLMARDRDDRDTLSLTHGALAAMLGVRRAGVTVALQQLETDRLITSRRCSIRIENRDGLKSVANGSYGTAEEELEFYFPRSCKSETAVTRPVDTGVVTCAS